MTIKKVEIPTYEYDTIVVGTGCAGYNAADWLYDLHVTDLAIVTEGINMGTSRNTGSDKQTYYKLSMASNEPDSIGEMARTLADGIGVNGDTALIEAACSVKSFFKLANLGVPFPTNIYGEYVGYKTDHDPRQRATSAGPLTSKFMVECLERSVKSKPIPILDHMTVVSIITDQGKVCGALAIDSTAKDNDLGLVSISCRNIILATGGPASAYYTSVYPGSQTGMSGIALEAGAAAANLQEWQYGLASTKFRWNVSGTYQQVLPRFIAVGRDGREREFLNDYFHNPFDAVNMVFLKGYQWPFDSSKIHGSSIIDLIVHHETSVKGNRVYMDFTRNPSCIDQFGFEPLSDEAAAYLRNSHALFGTPIKRLEKMNTPAIDLYAAHNIDLRREPLEVAICAQHCNGGIAVDMNWQSTVQGLYVVGEAAGTFGVYRPGGSALNSTQVGSMRAAEHIAYKAQTPVNKKLQRVILAAAAETFLSKCTGTGSFDPSCEQKQMSLHAAHIRNLDEMIRLRKMLHEQLSKTNEAYPANAAQLRRFCKYRDMLIVQLAMVDAMYTAGSRFGSRGSALILKPDGEMVLDGLSDYRFCPLLDTAKDVVVETSFQHGDVRTIFQQSRPLPSGDDWFENVWNDYKRRTKQ